MNGDSSNGASLALGAAVLEPDVVARFASGAAKVTPQLSDDAAKRVDRSAALRDELVVAGQPLYGVATGLGDSARRVVSSDKAPAEPPAGHADRTAWPDRRW